MDGHLFITLGDITRFQADAIAVTWGLSFDPRTPNHRELARFADDEATFHRSYEHGWSHAGSTNKPTFWVPLSQSRRPYGVVFVSPHRAIRPADLTSLFDVAHLVVQEAVEAAVEALSGRCSGRMLVALIAFRMGMGGDRQSRLRSARAQIRAAYNALEMYPDLDLVFVVDEPTKYEVFLEARRQVRAERNIPQPALTAFPPLKELVTAIQNDECTLFVGAGMSLNAGLMSYPQLIRELATTLGMDGELTDELDSYLDIAQCYRDTYGDSDEKEKRVESIIARYFGKHATQVRPSLAHYLLLSLPIRFIVTTNYDALLEETLEALRRYAIKVLDADQVAQTGYRDGTFVVKFHGDADTGRVVLSREDYDAFFRDRPEMAALLEGLLLNQTFFFVGYSLRDPNFRQIYGKIDLILRRAKRPAFAATLDKVKPFARQQYEKRRLHLLEMLPIDPNAADDTEADILTPTPNAGRNFLLFLDRLAEEVTGRSRLLLAPDVQDTPKILDPLCEALQDVGDRISELVQDPEHTLSEAEVRIVAQCMTLLTELGWRPAEKGLSLSRLWGNLANALREKGTPREQRQLLLSALRYSEHSRSAARLRRLITDLDKETP